MKDTGNTAFEQFQGNQTDQNRGTEADHVFHAAMSKRMIFVSRSCGHVIASQRDNAGNAVRKIVQGICSDGHGMHHHANGQFESKQEQIAYNACNAAKRAISKPYTLFLCVIGIWNQFLHQPFCHNWYSTPVVLLLPCLLFAKNSCFAVPAATGMKSRSRMEVQDGSSTAMAMILITA